MQLQQSSNDDQVNIDVNFSSASKRVDPNEEEKEEDKMSNFLGLSRDRSMNVAGDDGQSQSLSDETMIQDTPWKVLKQFAM